MSDFELEAEAYDSAIKSEAARLIRYGMPPWEAIREAQQRVAERRRNEARRAQVNSDYEPRSTP